MAQPMAEIGSRVVPDIIFQLHPASVALSDTLALHADWQYSTKIRQLPIPCLIQRPLRFDSVCNIYAATDVALELTLITKERRPSVEDPPIVSIMTLQPILHLERSSLFKCV